MLTYVNLIGSISHPAAPSGTATVLRLLPDFKIIVLKLTLLRFYLLKDLNKGFTSDNLRFPVVTGGLYEQNIKIHRNALLFDY